MKPGLFTVLGVAAGAVGTAVLAPVALTMAGFTSAGIAAGSLGASMMSSAAIANGGGVAAGSLVALLQSAGKYRCCWTVCRSDRCSGISGWCSGCCVWRSSRFFLSSTSK
ncbi:interferon alpha inducible protein 27.6 isoform X1 [Danio rerio]|uniref:Interferon alpha inducible protein 27.6 isoform X1 n=1 Tax=Danio rerio TaxID=7955 RepID=A0AC58H138_DANRE